jgi:ribosomal protein S1
MKSKEIEDERRGDLLFEKISSIIKKKIVLTISFITESTMWSPGLQIIASIKKIGEQTLVRDYEDEQVYQYHIGLITKQHIYSAVDDISSSDGVFCIFDARNKDRVDPKWKEIIVKIIENSKDKGVILIGIRAAESTSWSQIIEELNVDEQLDNKVIDLFFFRIGANFRLDIFDQLKSMLSAIDDKY